MGLGDVAIIKSGGAVMNTSKIIIKNLFGITEVKLTGKSIEATGKKGVGKSSILDAIKYALTNSSEREYIIKNGENEGEILIETDTGLSINRKIRRGKADMKTIKENGVDVKSPESFLREIFTPLQLNPVEFCNMKKEDQNRAILDLIEFEWDLTWIETQFGEIPRGIDFSQNILKVLSDIQDEKGVYFMTRQNVNRDARTKTAFVNDISKDLPEKFDFEKWNSYSLSEKYQELEKAKDENNKIERAKLFKDSYDNKVRGLEATKTIAIAAEEKTIANEKESLMSTIERLKAEIISAEEKISKLGEKLEDKKKVIISEYDLGIAKLETDVGIANKYASMLPIEITDLVDEIKTAEEMKKHLNEYSRMKTMQDDIERLNLESEELTRKIELARSLPGEILKTAKIPIEGLTVENGIPLINGLPISNLSTGEQLDLCVSVSIGKPGSLKIILLDGTSNLDTKSRNELYAKCKEKGLQFIASCTTDNNELTITEI